jgi:molybdopterin molybdotransferase
VLPFAEARALVEQQATVALAHERAVQKVDLLAARGRVLAEEVVADRDLPPFPRAARDGYAIRAADVAGASQASPILLKVIGEIAAGASGLPQVIAGQAVAIMTGAPVPETSDAVVMVEHTRRVPEASPSAPPPSKCSSRNILVELTRSAQPGENIVPRAAESLRGAILLKSGTQLTPAALGLAASAGHAQLKVFCRPRVAVLATGSELVEVGGQPGAHQIRNSNSYSLAAQIAEAGAEPLLLGIAPDEPARLRALMAKGLEADLLLISGGVSVGRYDLVEQIMREFEAEFFFTGVLIQPGKPLVFGRAKKKYFFGLPGNPVSTLVTFDLFVRPMIDALAGAQPAPLHFVQARLKSEVKTKTGLTRFLPGLLTATHEQTEVELIKWQGSGDLVSAARANCYVVIPPDRERLAAGEMISLLPR